MKNKLDKFLLALLWTLACSLTACFWFYMRFGFNIFLSAHWQHLARMQANQTNVTPSFWCALRAVARATAPSPTRQIPPTNQLHGPPPNQPICNHNRRPFPVRRHCHRQHPLPLWLPGQLLRHHLLPTQKYRHVHRALICRVAQTYRRRLRPHLYQLWFPPHVKPPMIYLILNWMKFLNLRAI